LIVREGLFMRAFADDLQALLTIVQAILVIVSTTLSIIVFVWVRRIFKAVTGVPDAVVRVLKDTAVTGARRVSDAAAVAGSVAGSVGGATVGAVKATTDAARRRVLGS
jgi:hypothetical protein